MNSKRNIRNGAGAQGHRFPLPRWWSWMGSIGIDAATAYATLELASQIPFRRVRADSISDSRWIRAQFSLTL
jgi:hypothetical protein